MKRTRLFSIAAAAFAAVSSQALVVGDIAFTGFNADGTDGYAFVALTSIAAGTTISFTDDEWNGSAWTDSNEAEWTWTAPTGGVAEGCVVSVVDINNLFSGSPATSANLGSIAAVSDAFNNPGFSTTAETVYAYSGTRASSTLLAAISSDSAVNFGGLTGGSAIKLANSSDGGKYTGLRAGQLSYSGYLPLIGNVASNWSDVLNGAGDNNFNTTKFTTVPEPATMLGLTVGGLALLRRKKRTA